MVAHVDYEKTQGIRGWINGEIMHADKSEVGVKCGTIAFQVEVLMACPMVRAHL